MGWKIFKSNPKPGSSPLTAVPPKLCPQCKSCVVALNKTTGKYHDYCTKSCAAQAKGPAPSQTANTVVALCEQCGQKPKFNDGAKVHPYCGRSCARIAASTANPTPPSPISPTNSARPSTLRSARSNMSRTIPQGPICKTPGCSSPVYVGADGNQSKYCTRTHQQWGERGCISCRAAPKGDTLVMCQPCHDNSLGQAPLLVEVPEDHENYKSAATQFQQSWRHNTTCPEVRAVYKIVHSQASLMKYEQYLNGVEARGKFESKGKWPGNENRRWHGTRRKCNIGDKGITSFCADPGCSLCRIIKTSFDLRFYKGATGWGRFGAGIYTSSTSSKSNDYSKNEGIASNWKALLLNRVVVGRGKKFTKDHPKLTGPPAGYDSVLAEVGGALNYDELVVYNNDAARPSYLVMYESS